MTLKQRITNQSGSCFANLEVESGQKEQNRSLLG